MGGIAEGAKGVNVRVVGKGAEGWKLEAGEGISVECSGGTGVKG